MPGHAFLMSGMGASFRPAGPCPVMNGPHCAGTDDGAFMVADARTGDGSAAVRVALWRCRFCGALLAGLGRPEDGAAAAGPGEGIDVQEFTWLEEAAVLRAPEPARALEEETA